MTTLLLSEDTRKAKARFNTICHEITESRNLPALLRELNDAISVADDSIIKAILNERPYSGLDALKNEFWYLKFQILEKS